MRKETVKIDILVRGELKEHGLLIDYKGHIFKPPFMATNGRKYKLKEIKPFWNNKPYKGKKKQSISSYEALKINQVIYNHDKVLATAVPVHYKKRFDINLDAVPEDLKHLIVA